MCAWPGVESNSVYARSTARWSEAPEAKERLAASAWSGFGLGLGLGLGLGSGFGLGLGLG